MRKLTPTEHKALKAKWKKKLERSGFYDIEDDQGRIIDHKTIQDLQKLCGFRIGFMEAIRDYFYWAGGMVSRGKFKSSADRKIWKLHAEGLSSREIELSVPFEQSTICKKIKKIRQYLRHQSSETKD